MGPKMDWQRIVELIDGLASSCTTARALVAQSSDIGSGEQLFKSGQAIAHRIREFEHRHEFLPSEVRAKLTEVAFVERLVEVQGSVKFQVSRVFDAITILQTMASDIEFLLFDQQVEIRSRAERALAHLQWSIASSEVVRQEWIKAADREEACERLGATHLLLHGIFAFKANSPQARTDLVFHLPVDEQDTSFADGLVLTEWKRLRDPRALAKTVEAARRQSDEYAGGILGGKELNEVRYIVVITDQQMLMPADVQRPGFRYKHVNVAIQPVPPSKVGNLRQ